MSFFDDLYSLKGQTILVTGASQGLGQHFAQTLHNAGTAVVLAARNTAKLKELEASINDAGGRAVAVTMDVTSLDSVKAGFDEAEKALGPVSGVINNAGVTVTKNILKHTEEDYDFVMDTNVKGSWLVGQEAARRMVEHGVKGTIVNIASTLGVAVAGGIAPYAMSKTAVIQMTKAMALDLGRYGIRVNALAPGYLLTDLTRDVLESEAGEKIKKRTVLRRFAEPSELDGALIFMCSPSAGYMTGATLLVDGGYSFA